MAFQRHFFLFFVLCSSFLCSSQAYKFNVEWVLNASEKYDQWSGENRFQVNDVLVFNYKKGSDSVLVVHNETDYKNCNKTNPIKKLDDGDSEFSFDRSGPFYFISGKDQNCNNGQKLIVVVLAVRNYHHYPHPSVPPALSPVAKPPTSPYPAATHPTASPPLAPSPEAYTPATPPTSTSTSPSLAPAATPTSLSPSLAPSPETYTPALPPASPSPAATPEAYTPALTPASPSPAASTPEADTPAYTPAYTPAITPPSSSPVATPESSPPSPPEPTTPSPSTALSAPANSPGGTPSGNETVPAKTAPAPSSAWAINPTNVLVGSATLVLSLALSGTLRAF